MEMGQELTYVTHHIQKVVGIFMAMRDFANKLKALGHKVVYLKINATENLQNFGENLNSIISENKAHKFEYIEPDEYRVAKHLHLFCEAIKIPNSVYSSEHFYTSRKELKTFFTGGNLDSKRKSNKLMQMRIVLQFCAIVVLMSLAFVMGK